MTQNIGNAPSNFVDMRLAPEFHLIPHLQSVPLLGLAF